MTIKEPDGKERVLPTLNHPQAAEVMEAAFEVYQQAESMRTNWLKYSQCFYKAARIENAALAVEEALSLLP